jgi:hypothetical protein
VRLCVICGMFIKVLLSTCLVPDKIRNPGNCSKVLTLTFFLHDSVRKKSQARHIFVDYSYLLSYSSHFIETH